MAEKLRIKCPRCLQGFRISEDHADAEIRCLKCHQRFQVSGLHRTAGGQENKRPPVPADDREASNETRADANEPSMEMPAVIVGGHAAPLVPMTNADTDSELLPGADASAARIDRFILRRELGQGGFGMVYEAFDPRLQRTVALKVPTFGPNNKRRMRRFETEARSAAKLHHPNIVTVYENGQTSDGRLFIASEFVDGPTLKAITGDENTPLPEMIGWIRDLAEALAYAHSEGIVHRDIKPENILIDSVHRRPKVADFGLAKVLDVHSEDLDAPLKTQDGVLGTPAFMSPEQARGEISKVGPLSDQYSLGAVLYQCLTGKPPFSGSTYLVIAAVAGEEQPIPVHQLSPAVPRDLVAICEKAMSKAAESRYPEAGQFAEDLNRWLKDEPVIARRTASIVRLIRWCRRNPIIASLTTVLGMVLVSATVILSIALERAKSEKNKADTATLIAQQSAAEALSAQQNEAQQRKLAEQARRDAEESARDAEENEKIAKNNEAVAVAARAELQATYDRLKNETQRANDATSSLGMEQKAKEEVRLAKVLQEANTDYAKAVGLMSTEPDHALLWFARALEKIDAEQEKTDAMQTFESTVRQVIATELPQMPTLIRSQSISSKRLRSGAVAISPDASRVAMITGSGRNDVRLTVVDTSSGQELYNGEIQPRDLDSVAYEKIFGDSTFNAVCFGPDRSSVIVARGELQRLTNSNSPVSTPPYRSLDSTIEYHTFPDSGKAIVTRLFEVDPGPVIWLAPCIHSGGFDFIGHRVSPGAGLNNEQRQSQLYSWSAAKGASPGPLISVPAPVVAVCRRQSGSYLLATGQTVRELFPTGTTELKQFTATVNDIVLSPDDSRLAVVLENGDVHVYSRGESDARIFQHQRKGVHQAIFDRHSESLVTAISQGNVQIWSIATQRSRDMPLFSQSGPVRVSLIGNVVTAVCEDGNLLQWSLPQAASSLTLDSPPPSNACFSPDGDHILLTVSPNKARGAQHSTLALFDVHSGQQTATVNVKGDVTAVDFSDSGRLLAVSSGAQISFLNGHSLSAAKPTFDLPFSVPKATVIANLAVSETANEMIMLLSDGTTYSNTVTRGFRRLPTNGATAVTVSDDGTAMAIGTKDGRVALLQSQSATEPREFRNIEFSVTAVCFSADGHQLAVGTDSALVLLMKCADLSPIKVFQHPIGEKVVDVSFLADGATISTISDQGIYEWNIATGLKTVSKKKEAAVAAVSPSGRHVVEGHQVHAVIRAIDDTATAIRQDIEARLGLTLSNDGRLNPLPPEEQKKP